MHGSKTVAEFCQSCQGVFCLGKQACRTVRLIAAVQALNCSIHTIAELFGILQNFPTLFQRLVFPCFQLCLFNFRDLIPQGLHTTEFFALVHGHLINFPAEFCHCLKFLAVKHPKLLIVAESIQECQMIIFIKQGSRIVLTMNIDQLHTQFSQD